MVTMMNDRLHTLFSFAYEMNMPNVGVERSTVSMSVLEAIGHVRAS